MTVELQEARRYQADANAIVTISLAAYLPYPVTTCINLLHLTPKTLPLSRTDADARGTGTAVSNPEPLTDPTSTYGTCPEGQSPRSF